MSASDRVGFIGNETVDTKTRVKVFFFSTIIENVIHRDLDSIIGELW